jgi:toxin ParE1/3/4
MRVELHDEARTELAASAQHYDAEVPGFGARYLDQMWRGIGRILDSPHIGVQHRKKLRKLVTAGPFRYSIIYAVQPDVIFVVAFASHYKRPGYWRGRVAR